MSEVIVVECFFFSNNGKNNTLNYNLFVYELVYKNC